MKDALADFLRNQRILILGFGREGQSALRFIRQVFPDANIAVADQKPLGLNDITCFSGPDYLSQIDNYDIIIKSPGIALKDQLTDAQRAKISSCTDLFLRFCPNPIIGVTGTKGKSTTTALTHHILVNNGRHASIAGNIGKPCFDIIDELHDDSIVVLEISAHQLEYVQASPQVAILLNLYEEHFDHFARPDDYFAAKQHIYRYQSTDDLLIYGDIFQHANHHEIDQLPMHKIDLYRDHVVDFAKIHSHLLGEHYRYDIAAAIAACEFFGLSEAECLDAVASFRGLPHRLEFIGEFRNIKFYNDSIATAQEATLAALRAVPDTDTIILGGMDRGIDYRQLVDYLRHSHVRNVLLLPDTDMTIQRIFDEAPYSQNILHVADLEQAVQIAYQATAEQHSCLLSPAAASYNQYKNFEERGNAYRQLVQRYATL